MAEPFICSGSLFLLTTATTATASLSSHHDGDYHAESSSVLAEENINNDDDEQRLTEPLLRRRVEIEEPAFPIHPALEYETRVHQDDLPSESDVSSSSSDDDEDDEDDDGFGDDDDDDDDDDNADNHEESSGASSSRTSFASRMRRWRKRLWSKRIKKRLCFGLMVFSGIANLVLAKLVAIPMYNYPDFWNVSCHLLFIPIAFVLTWWLSRSRDKHRVASAISLRDHEVSLRLRHLEDNLLLQENNNRTETQDTNSPCDRFLWLSILLLDAIAASLQVLASIYLPGHLMVVLPLMALPCWVIASRVLAHSSVSRRQPKRSLLVTSFGSILVLLGLLFVVEPVFLSSRRRRAHSHRSFVCQAATDIARDCSLCQVENTQEACLWHQTSRSIGVETIWSLNDSNTSLGFLWDNDDDMNAPLITSLCQWIPTHQSTTVEDEDKVVWFWTVVVLMTTVLLTISAWYKHRRHLQSQRRSLLSSSESQSLQQSGEQKNNNQWPQGWIAVLNFSVALALAWVAYEFLSQQEQDSGSDNDDEEEKEEDLAWTFLTQFKQGWQCVIGKHVLVENTCHPDTACAELHTVLLLGLYLLSHVVYWSSLAYLVHAYRASPWKASKKLGWAWVWIVPGSLVLFAMDGLLPSATQDVTSSTAAVLEMTDMVGLGLICLGLFFHCWMSTSRRFRVRRPLVVPGGGETLNRQQQQQDDDGVDAREDNSIDGDSCWSRGQQWIQFDYV